MLRRSRHDGKRTLLAALSDGRVDGAAIATVRVGDVRVRRL